MIIDYIGVKEINGSLITLDGIRDATFEETVLIRLENGTERSGRIVQMEGDRVVIQVFEGTNGLSLSNTRTRLQGHPVEMPLSPELLGRIFDGAGRPADGLGELFPVVRRDINGTAINPVSRVYPRNYIETGISSIDCMMTLIRGQKLPIFSISGEPYNQLLARIAMQAEADVIVLGGMGLKYDDFLYFKDALSKGGALSRTVMFIHTASDPTVECMMIPDMALAVAEQFALQDRDVLVLLTDMTNFADALKEIAITQEQVPSNRGYPGDLYSQLASRYEKAVDFAGSGSVTILAVTTMPGDDVTHPVPDNTGYITEGQYYLKGGRIEPFGSLSRLKQNVNGKTRKDHRTLMDAMIRLYAAYKETLEKKNMGFSMSPWDEKLLRYGALFEEQLMDLKVNLPLEAALDLGWKILAECFEKEETGIKSDLADEFWPAP